MRGDDEQSGHLFSYLSPEQRVPADHPLRAIRQMTDAALAPAVAALRAALCADRPPVDSARAAAARVAAAGAVHDSQRAAADGAAGVQPAVSLVRGLGMDDAVWSPTTFTKNRDRLLDGDIARAFFDDVVEHARGRRLLSDEHFTVDGTLLEAWAGQKSFQRKDQPPTPPDDPGQSDGEFPRGAPLE